jgi:hypothetical protein
MTIEVDIAKGFPVPGVDLGMKVTGSMDTAHLEQARPVPGGKGLVGCRGYPSREPAPTTLLVARTMRPLYASIGKSPLGAAQSHQLRRFLQACPAHRRVSSPAAADG